MQRINIRPLIFVFIMVALPASIRAQFEVSASGGGTINATGSLDITIGQSACGFTAELIQGVQQPYWQPTFDTLRGSVCEGRAFDGFGYSLPSDSLAQVGAHYFQYHYTSSVGFDSLVTLIVDVLPNSTYSEIVTVCDSFMWHGTYYYSSTEQDYTAIASNGCDSIVSLQLTIKYSSSSAYSDQAAYSYTWNGQQYKESGQYVQTFTNASGCDSVVTLTLAVIDRPIPHIVAYSDKAVMIDHYPGGLRNGRVDYIDYRWWRADTILPCNRDHYCNVHHGLYKPLDGYYYVEVPADKSRAYWVRSNIIHIRPDHKSIENDAVFGLYPNPVAAGHDVLLSVDDSALGGRVELYDVNGRILMEQIVDSRHILITMPQSAGGYALRLTPLQGESVIRKIIVR